ncbi:flagellar hook-length control protein FliK [Cryobacterium lactosi]|uniref:Flagellar hook-length control protein FliK n=1 Tax=Cryobacterium lactosi TaxID=1259202 RepID=A0A4R9BPL2_9MICO|nr:flagellar hook-length control protein FliK [Cryobacterium lactosi]TFD87311.1 flagellar hook-length control protein FliK [Cryobacterium lactosi]
MTTTAATQFPRSTGAPGSAVGRGSRGSQQESAAGADSFAGAMRGAVTGPGARAGSAGARAGTPPTLDVVKSPQPTRAKPAPTRPAHTNPAQQVSASAPAPRDTGLSDDPANQARLAAQPAGTVPAAFLANGAGPDPASPGGPRRPGSAASAEALPTGDLAGAADLEAATDAVSPVGSGDVTVTGTLDAMLPSGTLLPTIQPAAQASAQSGASGSTAVSGDTPQAATGVDGSSTAPNGTATNATSGNAGAANGTATNGSAANGTASTQTGSNGPAVNGAMANGLAVNGTNATGPAAAGTAAAGAGTAGTGAATAGAASRGDAVTGTASTGTAATGAASTGTSATETSATGTSATGLAATALAATALASNGAANGGATGAVWSTRSPDVATGDSAAAESQAAGLVPPSLSGPVAPANAAPAGAAAAPLPTGPAVPVPLASQVARPLFSLAAAGPGEHTMSISVTPDNLGPVVVRAQISAAGIRLELFAPTDMAREALRLILPDLRRDLAGGALAASLDVSARNQPGDAGSSGRQDRPAADQQGQGSATLGGDPREAQDRRREPGTTDPWLRPMSIGAETTAVEAGTGPAGSDQVRGRVDVLA